LLFHFEKNKKGGAIDIEKFTMLDELRAGAENPSV
jgi:hypothetical protein